MKKHTQNAFTLIELLIVIAIIGILASIVLVSLSSARERASNASAVASLRSVGSELFECLVTKGSARIGDPADSSRSICVQASDADVGIPRIDLWPEIATTGWGGAANAPYPEITLCDPYVTGDTLPASCSTFSNGNCGSDYNSGEFCFIVTHTIEPTKKIWCTLEEGCQKSGF